MRMSVTSETICKVGRTLPASHENTDVEGNDITYKLNPNKATANENRSGSLLVLGLIAVN